MFTPANASYGNSSKTPTPPGKNGSTMPIDPSTLVPPATANDEIISRWVRRWTNEYAKDASRKLKEAAKIKSLHRTPHPLVRCNAPFVSIFGVYGPRSPPCWLVCCTFTYLSGRFLPGTQAFGVLDDCKAAYALAKRSGMSPPNRAPYTHCYRYIALTQPDN